MKNNKFFTRISAIILILMTICVQFLVGCSSSDKETNAIATSFGGRSAYIFKDINEKDVRVESFYINQSEAFVNNPNIGQAVMLNGAIDYKKAHPTEDVYATITSFHYSVVLSVCLDENSENYLKTKSLYGKEYDDEGYIRIAYLAVKAAMCGVNVIVIGQIDASPVNTSNGFVNDESFVEYYTNHLDNDTEIEGKKVSDFLTFREAKWTSYGDKSATDMMHLKSCTVSNYRLKNKDYGCAIWLGSINLDGIDEWGVNGNNSIQTGIIITEHDEMYNALYNYTKLMSQYCEQEDIYEFRDLINLKNKEQIDLLLSGQEEKINKNEQIVYLGSKNDDVFELYFTPLAGGVNDWDAKYNPYSKYFEKLLPENNGNNDITFAWGIAKFNEDSSFSKTMIDILIKSFKENSSDRNRLFISVADNDKGIDYSLFKDLIVGQNIQYKSFDFAPYHSKDFQLSYVENGKRYYVSVLNSLNFHQGSAAYQTNSFLVIKETKQTGNNVYTDLGKFIAGGAITEQDRVK